MNLSFQEIIHQVGEADPALLAGDDSYVMDCRNCPLNLPSLVVNGRLLGLEKATQVFLEDQADKGVDQISQKVLEWLSMANIDLSEFGGMTAVGLSSECGVWSLHFGKELGEKLKQNGVNVDVFVNFFNDQHGAMLNEEMNAVVEHSVTSHPGVVTCGGTVEVGGRVLCGASVKVEPCASADTELIDDVIMTTVQNSLKD